MRDGPCICTVDDGFLNIIGESLFDKRICAWPEKCGLIMGRKAFQKPFGEGVRVLQSVQEVYLDNKINIA